MQQERHKTSAWKWLHPLSGTYSKEDVHFLLAESHYDVLNLEEKQHAIRQGIIHYSECINEEDAPSSSYLQFYFAALQRHQIRLAKECITLAQRIFATRTQEQIIWVSLARAGTPIGILLHRLCTYWNIPSWHYSISVIKNQDHGLDLVALNKIANQHDGIADVVWVDGWVGRGSIYGYLQHSIATWNKLHKTTATPPLAVISDPSGHAEFYATQEDYLLPHALLNATISGCISRTTQPLLNNHSPHGAKFFDQLVPYDQSINYVECIWKNILLLKPTLSPPPAQANSSLKNSFNDALTCLRMQSIAINEDSIKVGIPETTRVFLRRTPDTLFIKNMDDPDTHHLIYLAQQRKSRIIECASLPYKSAVTMLHS